MQTLVLLPLLLALAAPGQAPVEDKPMEKPRVLVSDLASFPVPKGWTKKDYTEQGDPQARLEKGLHAINVRLAGGPGSRYKSADEFLAGFEARSSGGKPAEKADTASAAGEKVLVYRRQVPFDLPPPDESGPALMAPEEFCVVPAGKRFFILTYFYADSLPDLSSDGKKAWREFLRSFRVKKR